MPSINMIAVRREEKRRQEQNIRKLLYAILGEIGLVVAVAFVLTARILVTQNEINKLSDRVKDLQPSVTKIQQLQTQTAALMPKVQTLDGAKADTLFWYKNFYAVTTSLPPRTWLTSLATGTPVGTGAATPGAAGGGDPTLSLVGVAMSQAVVGEAMLRMNQAPSLDHVDLAFVQQQKVGTTDAVGFQMTVHLKPEAGAAKDNSKPATKGDTKTAEAKGAVNGTKS
jgi:Tfp pilus assembly protein PilN